MSISIGFGAIRSWNVSRSPKSPKKFIKNFISQVIEFGGNRESVYDFLLVINSSLVPYLAPLLRYSDLLAKNRKFFQPRLI